MSDELPTPNDSVTSPDNGSGDAQLRHTSRENSVGGAAQSAEDKATKRRAHRKSRFGCRNCKARRIKCDERKPECTNCRTRQVRCDYLPQTTPKPSHEVAHKTTASPEGPSRAFTPGALNIADIELMYHWCTTTSKTLAFQNTGATHWRSDVTEQTFTHPYALHLIFAVTALHLAHCRPARRDEYLALADSHYAAALPSVTSELSHLNQDNCDAVLISVQLICFNTWARGPQSGEFLAFGDTGRSQWLIMFRGIRTTIETLDYGSFTRSHAPSIRAKTKPLPAHPDPPNYEEALSDLRDYIKYASVPAQLETNMHSLDILWECYRNRYTGVDGEYHVVFSWLYKMTEEFLEAMQRHDAVPLVLYAHFAVLMHDLERFWYMRGWTAHVMSGVWGILRDEDRVHVRWAIAAVGWIPP